MEKILKMLGKTVGEEHYEIERVTIDGSEIVVVKVFFPELEEFFRIGGVFPNLRSFRRAAIEFLSRFRSSYNVFFGFVKGKDSIELYAYRFIDILGRPQLFEVYYGKKLAEVIEWFEKKLKKFLKKEYSKLSSKNYESWLKFLDELIAVEKRVKEAGMLIASFIKYLETREDLDIPVKNFWAKLVLQIFVMYYLHRKFEDEKIGKIFRIFDYPGTKLNPEGNEVWEAFVKDYEVLRKVTKNLILTPTDMLVVKKEGISIPNRYFVQNNLNVIEWLKYGAIKRNIQELRNSIGKESFDSKLYEFFEKFEKVGILELLDLRPWYETNRIGDIIGGVYEGIKRLEERKKGGIYYTPFFIVKYIVDNTVEPYLVDRVNELGTEVSSLEEFIRNASAQELKRFFEFLVNIRILDPACGTGHFLVYAMEKLASYYRLIAERAFELGLEDLKIDVFIRDSRREIPIINDLLIDKESGKVKDNFEFLVRQHLILKNNIFGVDIDEEAHLIAKARLTVEVMKFYTRELHRLFAGFPNLEMNIKRGNSLIGFASWDEVMQVASQGTLLDFIGDGGKGKVEEIMELMEKAKLSDSIAEYKRYMQEVREKLNRLFILFLKRKGVKIKLEELKELKPFHWIAEFPIVFFDFEESKLKPRENPGFDVIVGNPPYKNVKRGFSFLEKKLVVHLYHFACGQYDYFELFIERSIGILGIDGVFGMILPLPFLYNENYELARNSLSSYYIYKIGYAHKVFEDASVENCLIFLKKQKLESDYQFFTQWEIVKAAHTKHLGKVPIKNYKFNNRTIYSPLRTDENFKILSYVEKCGDTVPLSQVLSITRGAEIGKGSRFILPKGDFPLLRGEDVQRFYFEFRNKFVRKEALNLSEFKGQSLYIGPKILIRRVSDNLIATYDFNSFVCLNTIYLAKPTKRPYPEWIKFPLILLNSKILGYMFKILFYMPETLFPYIRISQLHILPIRFSSNQKLFGTLADYLLFLNATKERRARFSTEINFLDRTIADCLVYELYFKEKFHQDGLYPEPKEFLLEAVSKHLKPINYDRWAELYWRKKIYNNLNEEEEKELKELEEKNLKTVIEVVKKLQEDEEIKKWIERIRSHEWVKIIENLSE